MLRIGLTGGIGAGKSALSSTFERCGAVIVDGDVIAREVVRPGTEGLAALVEAFGDDILLPDGSLDRPALAAKAFRDDQARQTLNGIVHPLVGKRRAEIIASVPEDSVVVEDIPLLVESGMAPLFPLVVIVYADVEVRLRRLVDQRGMAEDDARARIAAQASDEQRRAVADIWLDNSGTPEDLVQRAQQVWDRRIVPFAHNLSTRQIAPAPVQLAPPDPTWPDQAQRILNRLRTTCGHRALRVDHIGSTAVPDFPPRTSSTSRSRSNPWPSPTNSPNPCCPPGTRASSASSAMSPRATRAAPSTATTATTIRRCGPSGFTPLRIPAGPPMCTSGWRGGPISSSPCCSPTG